MLRKRWIHVIMSLVIIAGLLAGCGGGEAEGQNKGEGSPNPDTPKEVNLNEAGMPIVKEPIELTFFTGLAGTNGNTPFEERLVYKEMAAMSNINVKFQFIPFDSLTEKRNLALANGDYPDAFFTARMPAADLMRYGAQGSFVQLDGPMMKYAPNLQKLMDKYPDLRKALTMPDGHIYSFPTFYSPEFLPMLIGTPLWVKQEYLDKLGLKEPQTIDEFYQFLKAVKSTDLNGDGEANELPYSGTGIGPLMDQLKGAWGLGNRGLGHKYVDMDPASDNLRFFRLTDANKELLEFLNKLYSEGLIDKDIFTQDSKTLYAKGGKGLLASTINPNPKTQFNGEGYFGLGALKGPHGDQIYSHIKVPMVWPGAFVITDKNEHPEATIRWMDYFFSDEGAQLFFMGKEGETYTKQADGTLEFVDAIKNNPEGLTLDQSLTDYVSWMGGSYPGYVQQNYFKGSESLPESTAVGEKAKPNIVKELWYNFNFTDEETEFMSTVGKDIESLITEMEAKFITGDAKFSEWDKYVKQVQGIGVDRYLEVYQAAYERYQNS